MTPTEARNAKVAVSESNLRRAASRLLSSRLFSTEIEYIQRVLGPSATQKQLDDKVLEVRQMPWSAIVSSD